MCMLDDSDGAVTHIDHGRYVAARKDHKCAECHRTIAATERYHREVYLWEGKMHVHKTCAHCMVVRGWLQNECGGWLYGAVEEDARGHCHGSGYGMDLYRAVVAMSQNWRKKDGSLRSIPAPIRTHDELIAAREAK